MSPTFRVVLEGRIVAERVLTFEVGAEVAAAKAVELTRRVLANYDLRLENVRATDVQRIDREGEE